MAEDQHQYTPQSNEHIRLNKLKLYSLKVSVLQPDQKPVQKAKTNKPVKHPPANSCKPPETSNKAEMVSSTQAQLGIPKAELPVFLRSALQSKDLDSGELDHSAQVFHEPHRYTVHDFEATGLSDSQWSELSNTLTSRAFCAGTEDLAHPTGPSCNFRFKHKFLSSDTDIEQQAYFADVKMCLVAS